MANIPGPSGSTPYRPHKWLFNKQEMMMAKSIQEGYTEEKELGYRQRATRFIQEMVDRLNEQAKDKGSKVTQLCVCAASIHMNRFYYFHSFRMFDYRDIAAACLFLAGKSEENPRKLDSIVSVWWAMKFPKHPRFPSNNHFMEARQLIVQLENVILQTIAFDLKVDLPHPVVLTLTGKGNHGCSVDHSNKKFTECVYFFATDVLCVTDWAIRYSAAEIAVCCVHLVSSWSNHEIPSLPDGRPWYHHTAREMTDEKLFEMSNDFLQIYSKCKTKLALHKFASRGLVHPPQQESTSKNDDPAPLLPPPPQPPQISSDSADSKDKNKDRQSMSQSEKIPRKSFIPDSSQMPKTIGLKPLHLPGMGPPPPATQERRREERKEDQRPKDEDRRKEKEKRREERRREERPEERERRKEEEKRKRDEERRKRDHDRISGQQNESHHPYKKSRPEGMTQHFVPAANNNSEIYNGAGKERASVSLKIGAPVSPPRMPSSMSRYNMPPPPLPPSMLSHPPPPLKNDLEEGEVE